MTTISDHPFVDLFQDIFQPHLWKFRAANQGFHISISTQVIQKLFSSGIALRDVDLEFLVHLLGFSWVILLQWYFSEVVFC